MVVDSNAVLAWLLDEPTAARARNALLDPAERLIAPDLCAVEILGRLNRARQERDPTKTRLSTKEFVLAWQIAGIFGIEFVATGRYISTLQKTMLQYSITAADAVYVALMVDTGDRFVTADRRLATALERPFGDRVVRL